MLPGGGTETVITQSGDGYPEINLFLEDGFTVISGATHTKEPALDALADILLGIRLYMVRNQETYIAPEIEVRSLHSSYVSCCDPRVLGQMIYDSMIQGWGFWLKGTDKESAEGKRRPDIQEVGRVNKMNEEDYSMQCPSFLDFAGKKEEGSKEKFRQHALDFALPIDAHIIRVLDTPAVNKVFKGAVDLSVDAFYGLTLSSGIRVDNKESELSAVLRHCAGMLGISVPYTVVSSSVRGINAMTMGTDEFSYIAVSSLMKAILTEEEMKFVLGHECGHIALGHVLYHTVLSSFGNIAELLPVAGPVIYQAIAWPLKAWGRRSEISADRAGLLCCQDVETACRTLLKLEAGFMNADSIDIEEYINDSNTHLNEAHIGRYGELMTEHPVLSKRMEALQLFAHSEKYYRLSGLVPEHGEILLDDKTLEKETGKIIKVIL